MKKLLLVSLFATIVLSSCGPAAEDRVQMDRLAKRMSDSMGNLIDSSLNDPEKFVKLGGPTPLIYQTNPMPQPTADPTATAK